MRLFAVGILLLFFSVTANARSSDGKDALAAYKSGDFERALPLLQAAAAAAPQDEELNAALLSSLVYQGQVDAAADAALLDEEKFPNSPVVIAARGEFTYYMGDTETAERLFRQALKLKEETPRAYLGLYRLYEAASMHATARRLILRAHALAPDDALITRTWMAFIPPGQQQELFRPFAESHPWFFKGINLQRVLNNKATENTPRRQAFELYGPKQEVTLNLIPVSDSHGKVQALALPFRLNDGRTLNLVLDTGASGVLISQQEADKARARHLGVVQASGIGDSGTQKAFLAVGSTCEIGGLHYKDCLVRAAAGPLRVTGDADGLIGTNLFSDYFVQIDFRNRKLHLTPQPPAPPDAELSDAAPPSDGWTRVFRFGHMLFLPTNLNGKSSGLFLIDTGSVLSNVDPTFARLSTKIHSNTAMRVYGISGDVSQIFRADRAVITFAGYRQKNIGLTSFNLNNTTEHHDVRIDGILGFSVLDLFRLTIDYRNGLVKLEYRHK
jgi:hypothetical protein